MSVSIKQFAEKIAEELVVEYKFTADRAVLAVKRNERIVKNMFKACDDALKQGARQGLYADTVVEAARSILGVMGRNVSSDYKMALRAVRVILAQEYGWDEGRIYSAIDQSNVILLKMVMKGYSPKAIAEILAENNVRPGDTSLSEGTSLPTSEPWGSD